MSKEHRLDVNLIESWLDFEIDPATIEKYVNEISKIGCTSFKLTDKDIEYIKEKEMIEKKEMVQHPSHYGGANNPYEAIKVIEAWGCNFNIGTTLRYLCRCGKKTIGGSAEEMRLEDLKKAAWYLNREIENIEKENNITDNPYQE